jgi:hypothetical protein
MDPKADFVGQRAVFKTELLPLAGGGADQTVTAEKQCSCHLVKTMTALITLYELADFPHLPVATNPVDRRKQILLTSQSPGETTTQLPLV